MNYPKPPQNGSALSPLWARQVCETLQSQRVTSGPGIRVTTTANGTTVAAVASGPAGAQGFPWGDQWLWGFEFVTVTVAEVTTTSFILHRPAMRVGGVIIPAIVRDGSTGATALKATLAAAPATGVWAVAVDLDWADTAARYGATLEQLATEADALTQPSPVADRSPERIPVAVFDGRTLVRDYIHGMYLPQVWVAP